MIDILNGHSGREALTKPSLVLSSISRALVILLLYGFMYIVSRVTKFFCFTDAPKGVVSKWKLKRTRFFLKCKILFCKAFPSIADYALLTEDKEWYLEQEKYLKERKLRENGM